MFHGPAHHVTLKSGEPNEKPLAMCRTRSLSQLVERIPYGSTLYFSTEDFQISTAKYNFLFVVEVEATKARLQSDCWFYRCPGTTLINRSIPTDKLAVSLDIWHAFYNCNSSRNFIRDGEIKR